MNAKVSAGEAGAAEYLVVKGGEKRDNDTDATPIRRMVIEQQIVEGDFAGDGFVAEREEGRAGGWRWGCLLCERKS